MVSQLTNQTSLVFLFNSSSRLLVRASRHLVTFVWVSSRRIAPCACACTCHSAKTGCSPIYSLRGLGAHLVRFCEDSELFLILRLCELELEIPQQLSMCRLFVRPSIVFSKSEKRRQRVRATACRAAFVQSLDLKRPLLPLHALRLLSCPAIRSFF